MLKRVLLILLASVMILSSYSCTKKQDDHGHEHQTTDTQEVPSTNEGETNAPETNAPETNAPETNAPETIAPETNAPETNAPETNAPETNAPETNAPETNAPETNAPETNAPHTCRGGTADCRSKAVCIECGKEYGKVDPANHASAKIDYTTTEKTHKGTYACCGASVAEKNHSYKNSSCVDCGYACKHKTYNNGVCAECGNGCAHKTTTKATCKTYSKCTACGANVGSYDKNNHESTKINYKSTEKTHKGNYECCGAEAVATKAHSFTSGKCTVCSYTCAHPSNSKEATCKASAVCADCGSSYGSKNSSNHESTKVNYTTTEKTHKGTYSCCGASVAQENHNYKNSRCVVCDYTCKHKNYNNGVCSDCGNGCAHASATKATCKTYAKCTVCGASVGTLDADNHESTNINYTKNDKSHDGTYSCCGASAGKETHSFSGGKCKICSYSCTHASYTSGACANCGIKCTHTGGTATCVEKAVCTVCGEGYGNKNASNHESNKINYTSTEKNHKGSYDCCGAEAVVTKAHSFENGKCKVCSYTCAHPSNSKEATCKSLAVCASCGISYGNKNSSNHESNKINYTTSEKTHKGTYSCCGASVAEKNHSYDKSVCVECGYSCKHKNYSNGVCADCGDGCSHTTTTKATCKTYAKCNACGANVGSLNKTNHESQKINYTSTVKNHKGYYDCCGAEAVVAKAHTYTNSKCTVCSYTCTHPSDSKKANCKSAAVCAECGASHGSKNPSNHESIKINYTSAEKTHKGTYSCCGASVPEASHKFVNSKCSVCLYTCTHTSYVNGVCSGCQYVCSHSGGTATCKAAPVCSACGSSYGKIDINNHAQKAQYTVTDTKHTATYNCCGATKKGEYHVFDTLKCVDCSYTCAHGSNLKNGQCSNCGYVDGLLAWMTYGFDKVIANVKPNVTPSSSFDVYLTKNETEGCQIGLWTEVSGSARSVKLALESGKTSTITTNVFTTDRSQLINNLLWPDPLLPYRGGNVSLESSDVLTFLVEFTTTKDTAAGDYKYVYALCDKYDNVIARFTVNVHVWDIVLPEDRVFETAAGLQGSYITWWNRTYTPGNMSAPQYLDYYEMLLDHGISAYNLPYDILDEKADAYMSDPRVTSFKVPECSYTTLWPGTEDNDELLLKYYNKIMSNPVWAEKAYFYPIDEPRTMEQLEEYKRLVDRLRALCPEIPVIAPYYTNIRVGFFKDQTQYMIEAEAGIYCPKLNFWDDANAYNTAEGNSPNYYPQTTYAKRMKALQEQGIKVWTYVCNAPIAPYAQLFIDTEGLVQRSLFWQIYQREIEGFLYWGVIHWGWEPSDTPDPNDDVMTNPYEQPFTGVGDDKGNPVYGEGFLIYPGNTPGVGLMEPIASFRLKAVRDGIEDIELFYLAEAVLGRDFVVNKTNEVTWSLTEYTSEDAKLEAVRRAIAEALEDALN